MSTIPGARVAVLGALILVLAVYALAPNMASGQTASATVEWDPVVDARVTGYLVFVSRGAGNAEWSIDAGLSNRATIPGLVAGVVYIFSVAAYTADGSLSDRSSSLSWSTSSATAPPPSAGQLATTLGVVTAIAALDDGRALFIEDGRRLLLTQPGTLQSHVIAEATDPSYLLSSVSVASDFATSHLVYLTAVQTLPTGDREALITRGRLVGAALGESTVVVSGLPPSTVATAIDGLGRIYVAVSSDTTTHRFPSSYLGSILRFNADGTAPGFSPVFSRGQNRPSALAVNDADSLVWLAGQDGVRNVLFDMPLSDAQPRGAALDGTLATTGMIVSLRARRGAAGVEGVVVDSANRRALRFRHSGTDSSSGTIELPPGSTPVAADMAHNGQIVIALRGLTSEVVLFRVARSAR